MKKVVSVLTSMVQFLVVVTGPQTKSWKNSYLCENTEISTLFKIFVGIPFAFELPHPMRCTSLSSYFSMSLLGSLGRQIGLINCQNKWSVIGYNFKLLIAGKILFLLSLQLLKQCKDFSSLAGTGSAVL